MKKTYITPVFSTVRISVSSMVCASPTITLGRRDGVAGEEADSRSFSGSLLWDDAAENSAD